MNGEEKTEKKKKNLRGREREAEREGERRRENPIKCNLFCMAVGVMASQTLLYYGH